MGTGTQILKPCEEIFQGMLRKKKLARELQWESFISVSSYHSDDRKNLRSFAMFRDVVGHLSSEIPL